VNHKKLTFVTLQLLTIPTECTSLPILDDKAVLNFYDNFANCLPIWKTHSTNLEKVLYCLKDSSLN